MANKTLSQLNSISLPVQDTDKILISRDGINVNQTEIGNLQFPIISTVGNIRQDYNPQYFQGKLAFLSDLGVNGAYVRSNGSRWAITSRVTLVNDNNTFTRTNTTVDEQVVSTYVIPGWLMGPSGRLVIEPVATFANTSTLTKTMKVRFTKYGDDILGANSKILTARANTSMTITAPYITVGNTSEYSQIIPFTSLSTFVSSSSQALNTSSIDTTEDIVISATLQYSATTPSESGSIVQFVINMEP